MSPSNEQRAELGASQTYKNTHHIFAPTAAARITIFPKLCMVRTSRPLKKLHIIFRCNA